MMPKYLIYISSCLLILFSASCAPKTDPKPNIIFVMMDDLGYGQYGVYNDTLEVADFDPLFVKMVDSTQGYSHEEALAMSKSAIPTMTELVKNGILFTHAYTSSNLCSPSRLGIATGILQNQFGVYENADGEHHGLDGQTHLATKLKSAGYKTAHIGKWHIGRRNRKMLTDILAKYDLPKNSNYFELAQTHPEVFKEAKNAGYYGSVIDDHHPLNNGFDYYYGYNTWASQFYNSTLVWENFEHAGLQTGYNTDVFTDRALDFMAEQVEDHEPFYVQLHYHAVHDSLEPKAPEKYFDKFPSSSFDLSNFYAHIYGVDANVKRIIDFLKSKDQFDNTLIIFTSDNGAMAGVRHKGSKVASPLPGNAPFSGHKGNFYQGGIRVPLFMHWPEGIEQPYTSSHLTSTLDIMPTAIDAATGELVSNIDGKSVLPLFHDPNSSPVHNHLLWAGMHSTAWGFLIENSTKDHHTERPFAPAAWTVIKGDYLLRFVGKINEGIYYDHMEGRESIFELFNIKVDPAERHNIASENPEIIEEMSALFFERFDQFPPPATWGNEKWEELKASRASLN